MKNNLRTLEILHYVYGAVLVFFGLFPLLYYALGTFLNSGALRELDPDGSAPPPFVGHIMQALGLGLFMITEAYAIMNIASAVFIGRKRYRVFSMVVAGLDCLRPLLGTALGVFTLIELSKEDVKQLYSGQV